MYRTVIFICSRVQIYALFSIHTSTVSSNTPIIILLYCMFISSSVLVSAPLQFSLVTTLTENSQILITKLLKKILFCQTMSICDGFSMLNFAVNQYTSSPKIRHALPPPIWSIEIQIEILGKSATCQTTLQFDNWLGIVLVAFTDLITHSYLISSVARICTCERVFITFLSPISKICTLNNPSRWKYYLYMCILVVEQSILSEWSEILGC